MNISLKLLCNNCHKYTFRETDFCLKFSHNLKSISCKMSSSCSNSFFGHSVELKLNQSGHQFTSNLLLLFFFLNNAFEKISGWYYKNLLKTVAVISKHIIGSNGKTLTNGKTKYGKKWNLAKNGHQFVKLLYKMSKLREIFGSSIGYNWANFDFEFEFVIELESSLNCLELRPIKQSKFFGMSKSFCQIRNRYWAGNSSNSRRISLNFSLFNNWLIWFFCCCWKLN